MDNSEHTPFRNHLWVREKKIVLTAIGLSVVEFILFKFLYPYPDFFSDSYSYIFAAMKQLDVNIWPIGYSKFLSLFHIFVGSGSGLIIFQFVAYLASALYFYLTLTYFFSLGGSTRLVLFLFLFCNPMFFYLINYVSSDILFASMTIVWITQLIWTIHRPRAYQVFVQAALVLVLFSFRYNAMIYPVLGAGVWILAKQQPWVKVLGIGLGPLLVLGFIVWSGSATQKLVGDRQFPPILGGWQWANNALYIRAHISEDSAGFPTPETAELDQLSLQYFSRPDRPQDRVTTLGNWFIRKSDAPLKQYMKRHYPSSGTLEGLVSWGKVASVYDQYGKFVVRRHPAAFAQFYLWPNLKNYLVPPLDLFATYNLGSDQMWPIGQRWFHYNNPKMWCISPGLQGAILDFYPWAFLLLNIYFLAMLILFTLRGGFRKTRWPSRLTVLFIAVFLALNAGFSIFANSIVLRYQVVPMLILLSFAMLLTDFFEQLAPQRKPSTHPVR